MNSISAKCFDPSKSSQIYEGRRHFRGAQQRYNYPPIEEKKSDPVAKPEPKPLLEAFRSYCSQDHRPAEFDPKKTWRPGDWWKFAVPERPSVPDKAA